MPAPVTTVFASSAGTGATVNLDWMAAGPVTVRITTVSTSGTGCRLEATLNDPMISSASIGNSTTAAVLWTGISSQGTATWLSTAALSSGALILSSNIIDSQLIYQFVVPLAAIRLNCSGASSGGIRMDVIQGKSF